MKKDLLNEIKLNTLEILKEEREISNGIYAMKLIEKIVFTLVAMICIAVLTAILKLVIL